MGHYPFAKAHKSFSDKIGLFFNSKKTMCIIFYDSAKCSPIVQYPIPRNSEQLKWFSSVKHLDHIFDCCLSFAKNNHVKKCMVLVFMAVVYGIYLGQMVKNSL